MLNRSSKRPANSGQAEDWQKTPKAIKIEVEEKDDATTKHKEPADKVIKCEAEVEQQKQCEGGVQVHHAANMPKGQAEKVIKREAKVEHQEQREGAVKVHHAVHIAQPQAQPRHDGPPPYNSPRKCYRCGQEDHIAKDCPVGGEFIRGEDGMIRATGGGYARCFCCGRQGHHGGECRHRHPNSRTNNNACYHCGGEGEIRDEHGHRRPHTATQCVMRYIRHNWRVNRGFELVERRYHGRMSGYAGRQ